MITFDGKNSENFGLILLRDVIFASSSRNIESLKISDIEKYGNMLMNPEEISQEEIEDSIRFTFFAF